MEEIWKPVDGYEGYYEVSNLGRVRSIDRFVKADKGMRLSKGQLLKPFYSNGYARVVLSKQQKTKKFSVHRLVAIAFIPNTNNYPQVNHKNEDKNCNEVDNLEWCNGAYNCNYGTRNQRLSEINSR